MRFVVSLFLASMVWFAASQAMADVEAIISAADDFCCYYSGIWVSAEGSTNYFEEADEVWWDFDNDGNYEIQSTDIEGDGTVFAEWDSGDVYTIKLYLVDYEGPNDGTTASPFNVGEPIITTASYEVKADVPVTFSGTSSKPTSMTRSYQWDFEYDEQQGPDWDSTSGTDTWTFSAGEYTVLLRVSYSSPGGYQGYCEETVNITAT